MFLCVRSLGWTTFLKTDFPQSPQREGLSLVKKKPEKTNILTCAITSAYSLKLSRATLGITQGDAVAKEYQKRAVIKSTNTQLEAGLLLSNTETLLFLTSPEYLQKKKSLPLHGKGSPSRKGAS